MRRQKALEVDLIFRIAAIGIIVAVLDLVLRNANRPDQAMMTTLAGVIVVLMMMVNEINSLFETVKSVFGLY
jgi:stage III sporulation protein AC